MSLKTTQLLDHLEIDRNATRKRVEGVLETARIYRHIGFIRRETKVISGYEPRFHGSTNKIGKVTEQAAVYNADTEEKLRQLSEELEQALLCLESKEQEIIRKRYLQRECDYDFLLCHEVNLSERTYRRVKARAIEKLAYMLRLEVIRA